MNTLGFIILTTALSFAVIFISFYASHLNRQLKRMNGHLSAYKQNLENHRRVHAILASERDAKENLATELQTRNAELKQDISRLQGEIEAVHLRYKPKRGKDGKFVRKAEVSVSVSENKPFPTELLNVTATPKVVDEHGNDLRKQPSPIASAILKASIDAGAFTPNEQEQEKLEATQGGSVGLPKHPRPISSLKRTEAIQVNNEAERDAILELMGKEGWKWKTGVPATAYMPSIPFPHLLSNNYMGIEGISWGEIEPHIALGDTILPASDFLPNIEPVEQKETRDWSVPQAFPKDYKIPMGVECVTLIDSSWGHLETPKGTRVKTVQKSSCPFVERLDGIHRKEFISKHHNGHTDDCYDCYELAPINPTDHPEHPQFKGEK